MSVIVTDTGFAPDDWQEGFAEAGTPEARAWDFAQDADPAPYANAIPGLALIRIAFPAFSDGRGFTLAKRLRRMGFTGRLRAHGHVISDQYAMARRSGFDEIEISEELAARQPEGDWVFRADWQANDYQNRLRRFG